jgi:hypothetical protein
MIPRVIVAPQKPEPLLAEASNHRDQSQGGEDANVDKGLPDEAGHVAIGDRGHEIPTDEAVDYVEGVRRAEEQDQRGENEFRFPADFGLGESPDRTDETRCGRLQVNRLRIHEL